MDSKRKEAYQKHFNSKFTVKIDKLELYEKRINQYYYPYGIEIEVEIKNKKAFIMKSSAVHYDGMDRALFMQKINTNEFVKKEIKRYGN